MFSRPLRLYLLLALGLGSCRPVHSAPPDQVKTAPRHPGGRGASTREALARDLLASTLAGYEQLGIRLHRCPVSVEMRTQDDFVRGLGRTAHYFELPGLYHAMSAVGRLLGADVGRSPEELRQLAPIALGQITLGFYDFDDKTLVIRDDPSTNSASLDDIVAHELGHAHQDCVQGGLRDYIKKHSGSPDELRAAHALLEGQATLFGEALRLHPRGFGLQALDPNLSDPSVGRLTSGEGYSLIYEAGRRFLLTRHRKDGIAAIVAALQHPPSSTEQLLHPEKYERDLPRTVELPPVPPALQHYPPVFEGTLGEFLLYSRLLEFKRGWYETRLAVTGWDGDRLRVLALPNGSYALVWRLVWDRPVDAAQFCRFVAPLVAGASLVRVRCHDNLTEISYAETPIVARQLEQSLEASHPSYGNAPEDAKSSAAAEAEYQRLESLRPTVVEGRWQWPALGMSFRVPGGFVPLTLNDVDILAATPREGFADNISVTFEQDLYPGELLAYVRDQQQLMSHTNQVWIGSQTVDVAGASGFVIQTRIPNAEHSAVAFLLLLARPFGLLTTITIATRESEEALGKALVAAILDSLELWVPDVALGL